MTAPLFTICFISTATHALSSPRLHITDHKALVVASKKPNPTAWRQRHRRARRPPSSLFVPKPAARRRRRPSPLVLTCCPDFVLHVAQSFIRSGVVSPPPPPSLRQPGTDSQHQRLKTPPVLGAARELFDIMEDPTPRRAVHARSHSAVSAKGHATRLSRLETMPQPQPPPPDEAFESPPSSFGARSTRSLSTTSRNSNRLSLTLPIALPTTTSSRPTPISTTVPSLPPTPRDTPVVGSPTDANDFIHAIAAQERKVLELREDLKGAEMELARLKKQWGAFDSVRKRNAMVNGEPLRQSVSLQNSPTVDDVEGKRRSIELDRRRTMLMSQQLNKEMSPASGRRRVIRGGHTRALSLLSPTKPDGAFPILEDDPPARDPEPHVQGRSRQPLAANGISKRATWTPRSSSSSPSNNGVKQMAEDFKAGLWTFMDDLRQVAVGDEPINGGAGTHRRVSGRQSDSDRDTIRASVSSSRPHVANAFHHQHGSEPTIHTTPTPTSRFTDPLSEFDTANLGRPKRSSSRRTKHFSWTPLTCESLEDSDWSNWDSPPAISSPRWSGTTVTGDIITTAIPEGKADENDTSSL